MAPKRSGDADHLLRRLLLAHSPALEAGFRWVWERDRWTELLFALLVECTDEPQADLRRTLDDLDDLDLLDPGALAAAAARRGGPGATRHGRRVLDVLLDAGFEPDEAERSLVTICEAARGVADRHGGRVQLYLREQGERMRRELADALAFSALERDAVERALTLWLQNALELPLTLPDEGVDALCRAHGIAPEQLVEAADALGLNLALLDDLVQHELLARALAAADAGPTGDGTGQARAEEAP